jgi:hypothetical protein
MEHKAASTRNRAIMSDPTSAQMPSAIDATPARSQIPAGQPPIPGGTSLARHPFVLPDVRDRGSDEEHREEHTPEQDDDPFGRGHEPSLANARPWRWSGVKPFTEELKPFTEEGDPPRWIPFFLTTTLVDRTS